MPTEVNTPASGRTYTSRSESHETDLPRMGLCQTYAGKLLRSLKNHIRIESQNLSVSN